MQVLHVLLANKACRMFACAYLASKTPYQKSDCQSMHICLKNYCAKFHPNPIWNDQLWTFLTRKPSSRKGYVRQRHHSKMAASYHLGFYRTGNSAIWSADAENLTLEANITSIGEPVAKLWPFLAVIRHLGFYRTANSAIRSADPENHNLERNMEWIRCTVCEIFAFKLYCDLEIGVQGHSSKVALFDRAHTTLYSSSIVTMPLSLTVSEI